MNLYKELVVYQRAYRFAISIYKYAKTMPQEERYGLVGQLQRCATSIPLNIAEGYGKDDSKSEIKRYLKMAKGSCAEMDVLLDICKDVGYMEQEDHAKYADEISQISRMLYQLVKSLN